MKRLDKAFDNIEEENMHCPHLEEGKISTCHANSRTVTSRNEYEINYLCLTWRYKDCLIYKKHLHEGGTDA